jgi:hypothetical protein
MKWEQKQGREGGLRGKETSRERRGGGGQKKKGRILTAERESETGKQMERDGFWWNGIERGKTTWKQIKKRRGAGAAGCRIWLNKDEVKDEMERDIQETTEGLRHSKNGSTDIRKTRGRVVWQIELEEHDI